MNPFAVIDEREMSALSASMTSANPMKLELIRVTLSLGVPLRIADLQSVGGPQDYHIEALQERYRLVIGSHTNGEKWPGSGFADLLMGGKSTRAEMALLCDMLALMAFQPGGVRAFGLRFEAEREATQ